MNHGFRHRETIRAEVAGRSVLDHLAARWRHGIASAWRERIDRGEVTLDGASARGDELLRAGQELSWQRPPWEEPAVPLSFAVLHRDEHLLATAKPAGLPTMPSGGRFLEHTLLHQVRRRWPQAVPLHRLDRGTSGVVLFALSALARREVARGWQRGRVRRRYRGLIAGTPRGDELVLDAPIGELPHPVIGRVFAVADSGRRATTRVRVLERRGAESLVEIELGSGRPHQIRIHLAHAGHPLVGEPFFGPGGRPLEGTAALPGDPGYLLHAESIELEHPALRTPLSIHCTPPPRLRDREGFRARTSSPPPRPPS